MNSLRIVDIKIHDHFKRIVKTRRRCFLFCTDATTVVDRSYKNKSSQQASCLISSQIICLHFCYLLFSLSADTKRLSQSWVMPTLIFDELQKIYDCIFHRFFLASKARGNTEQSIRLCGVAGVCVSGAKEKI
jgi:hypothetical protein